MTAVTTSAASIAVGALDVALARRRRAHGPPPAGAGMDPNPRFLTERIVSPDALDMGKKDRGAARPFPQLTKERADAFAVASQEKFAKAVANGQVEADLVPVASASAELGWGLATADELARRGRRRGAWRTCARRSARTVASPRATPRR